MDREYKIWSDVHGEVTMRIMGDGTVQISGLANKAPNTDDYALDFNSSRSIWEMYKNYRSNDKVIRSGSGLCGVYPYNPKQPVNENYVENDTLHSTTVEELAQNIFRFYPLLFDLNDQKRIVQLLRYHDLGETVDNPDDGSKDKDEKFQEELETFVNKVSSLPRAMQEELIRDFIVFENAGSELWDKEQRKLMQFAKLCDKADAPLGALLYESQDRAGSLLFKKEHFGGITEQDEKYAKEIGEYSQAGIWSAHMVDTYLYFDYLDIFVEIIIEACKDVRGQVFPWMYEFCKKRVFSDIILNKML